MAPEDHWFPTRTSTISLEPRQRREGEKGEGGEGGEGGERGEARREWDRIGRGREGGRERGGEEREDR